MKFDEWLGRAGGILTSNVFGVEEEQLEIDRLMALIQSNIKDMGVQRFYTPSAPGTKQTKRARRRRKLRRQHKRRLRNSKRVWFDNRDSTHLLDTTPVFDSHSFAD